MKNFRLSFAIILILLISTVAISDVYAQLFYVLKSGDKLGYMGYFPPGYEESKEKFPCIIFLCGSGERGGGYSEAELSLVAKNGPLKHVKSGNTMCFTVNGKEECFVVIAPQDYTWKDRAQKIIDLHADIIAKYKIDPSRVYLTGLSMGGQGTYDAAGNILNEPNIFAAVSPISASTYHCDNAQRIGQRNIPLWHFHGDADRSEHTYAKGLAAYECVLSGNPTVETKFTTYKNVGHSAWNQAYTPNHTYENPNLYEWFLTKTLSSASIVNAGSDQIMTLPTNSVVLKATKTDPDNKINRVLWTKTAGGEATLQNSGTLNLTVLNLKEGKYTFKITAYDASNSELGSDEVDVIVQPRINLLPKALAGNDQSFKSPKDSTQVVGKGSDNDGTISSYKWSQVSGASATILNPNSSTTKIKGLTLGNYTFKLTVTDNEGGIGTDELIISVVENVSPTADAGTDKIITLPTNSIVIEGRGNDADGTIVSYQWVQQSGPSVDILNGDKAIATISNLVAGSYVFKFTVTDDNGATGTDWVRLTVEQGNVAPKALAGDDQTINLPQNSTNINGSGTDSDGSIVAYSWVQVKGPSTASLTDPSKPSITVTNLLEGTYVFGLTVTDNDAATGYDEVNIVVNKTNSIPSANAGPDIDIQLPSNSATLKGSGSDADGSIVKYLWTKKSGPNAVTSGASTPTLSVSSLVEGVYVFSIEVTDNQGATNSDEAIVTVSAANRAPTANAGTDLNIKLPTTTVVLNGQGVDNDGSIVAFAWTQKSGSIVTLSDTTKADLTIQGLNIGVFTFALLVTDDDGSTGYDEVIITVDEANALPKVNAGVDQSIKLPTNQVTLQATAIDEDGSIVSYLWEKTSGGSCTISNSDKSIASVSGLLEGNYEFQVTVADNDGAQANDRVKVSVVKANASPTVIVPSEINITFPVTFTTIACTATDVDGTVVSYLWEQTAGAAANMLNTSISTVSIQNLSVGNYTFSITVTDNEGAQTTEYVDVVVNAEPSNLPPIVTLGNDESYSLPLDSIVINGAAGDDDGTITKYEWTIKSGPNASLVGKSSLNLIVKDLVEGTYTFRLTATDDDLAIGFDDIVVNIFSQNVNEPPKVYAGTDRVIQLPNNSIVLNAQAEDKEGAIVSYEWIKISGPAGEVLTGASTTSLSITNLVGGIYTFQITVEDEDGAKASDQVNVRVKNINTPPNVSIGGDITIDLPKDSVELNALATDSDGSIASYLWSVQSAGGGYTLFGENTSKLIVKNLESGLYVFQVEVKDNQGATATDQVKVTVQAQNEVPIVNAGKDQVITLPTNQTNVSGSAIDPDGTIVSYKWSKVSGPAATLINMNSKDLTVQGLQVGTYIFKLTATDNDQESGFDEMKITVVAETTNAPPIAEAGPNKVINLPQSAVVISGSGSDVDGSVTAYLWEKISGPGTVTLTNQTTPVLTVNNLVAGTYKLQITVTDDDGETASDFMFLTVNPENVNQAPTAFAGTDQQIKLPLNTIVIKGAGSDVDGTIVSYSWSQISGPSANMTNQNSASLTLSNLVEGKYSFSLKVTDDDNASDNDEVIITVLAADVNTAPLADAGPDQEIKLPQQSMILRGKGSDKEGGLITYAWTKRSGAVVTLSNQNTANLTINGLLEGQYIFRLTVTDEGGLTNSDEVLVTVQAESSNSSPIVNAGSDIIIKLPINSVNLRGSASDVDGNIVSYKWSKTSGPNFNIGNDTLASTILSGLEEGVYVFRLTVADDDGAVALDEISITVNGANSNELPIVDAGVDQDVYLPTNSISITANASDNDGQITSYLWEKISGGSVSIENSQSATATFANLVEGRYQFRVSVQDNNGASASDEVVVNVVAESVNKNPVATITGASEIVLPTNVLLLSVNASDVDGQIIQIAWEQTYGPDLSISDTTKSAVSISGLIEGIYIFKVTVFDDDNATASALHEVTVLAEGSNASPTANAGEDMEIQLPTNIIVLSGSGYDEDGAIVKYQWKKISGGNATVANDTLAQVTVSDLQEGTYVFRLTVTDDRGSSATDDVQLQVISENVNQIPYVNLGNDIQLRMPIDSIVIGSSVSDADGTVVKWKWNKESGPSVTFVNDSAKSLVMKNIEVGDYIIRLTITDDDGALNSDAINVSVLSEGANQPPNANAGADITVKLPLDSLVINGIASDEDGLVSLAKWDMISGPSVDYVQVNSDLVLKNIVEGTYHFRFTVTDDDGESTSDAMILVVQNEETNQNPIVVGEEYSIILPQDSISITANASDVDGQIVEYVWEKVSGPSLLMSGDQTSKVKLEQLEEGTYSLKLTVTDNLGASNSNNYIIYVLPEEAGQNQNPYAYAGEDTVITFPIQDFIRVGESYDTDGSIESSLWRQVFGPNGNSFTINSDTLILTNLAVGDYTFEYVAYDNEDAVALDEFELKVTPGEETLDLGISKFISPDGSGNVRDDFWYIERVDLIQGCRVLVFNRSGKKVLETTNYQNDWDATYQGKSLPEGDYYYIIQCPDKEPMTGGIRVLRSIK